MVNYQHQGECVSFPKEIRKNQMIWTVNRRILLFPVERHSQVHRYVFMGFSETSLKFKNMRGKSN